MSHILIVEDDTDLAMLVTLHLRQAGHDVQRAESGQAALAALANFKPDLVLLDLLLPDVVGLSLCETLRATEATAQVPIVFVSGCHENETRRLSLEAGADDFIVKPFDLDDLINRVEAQLAIAHHFRRPRRLRSPTALTAG